MYPDALLAYREKHNEVYKQRMRAIEEEKQAYESMLQTHKELIDSIQQSALDIVSCDLFGIAQKIDDVYILVQEHIVKWTELHNDTNMFITRLKTNVMQLFQNVNENDLTKINFLRQKI